MNKSFVCKFPEDGWTVWDFDSRTVIVGFNSWKHALAFSMNPTDTRSCGANRIKGGLG